MTSEAAFTLSGKHAVVAGVGGPLARAAAVALAEGGATVSLLTHADDREQEVEAQSILNECWSLGHDGQVCRLDSTDESAVEGAIDRLESQFGRVAVLVTVPPEASHEAAATATRRSWRAEISRSATPAVVPVLAAGRRMIERGEGRIVNVVSEAPEAGEAGSALFAGAQGAVLAFSRALDGEWRARGVRTRALIVGAIEAGTGPNAHGAFREQLRSYVVDSTV